MDRMTGSTPANSIITADLQRTLDKVAAHAKISPELQRVLDKVGAKPLISADLQRTLDVVARTMKTQEDRMAPIQKMIDAGVLADIRKTSAKMQAALVLTEQNLQSPAMTMMAEDFNARHAKLMAKLSGVVTVSDLASTIATHSAREIVRAAPMPARDTAPESESESRPERAPSTRITREQQVGALLLLLSLHSYLMDLRDADLADVGSLLLLIAALAALLLLSPDSE